VRKEFNESYSGSLGYFSLDWKYFREKRGFQIGFEFQGGTEIKHRNLRYYIIGYLSELNETATFIRNRLSISIDKITNNEG